VISSLSTLGSDHELARALPAARRGRCGFIGLAFGADQDVGQLAVGRAPGFQHRVGRGFCTQHFANRLQQAGANHRIVFRLDLQRNVLGDDGIHQRAQCFQALDMLGVHQDTVGQGALLLAAVLVGLVEERFHLREVGEQGLVEVAGQCFAALLQDWNSGANDGTVFCGQHGYGSFSAKHAPIIHVYLKLRQ